MVTFEWSGLIHLLFSIQIVASGNGVCIGKFAVSSLSGYDGPKTGEAHGRGPLMQVDLTH